MSSKLFMGGVMAAGVIMAVAGGVDLGGLMGSAPFHYANATEQEKAEFLEGETKYLSKRVKRSVVNPSGVGWSAGLRATEHDTRRNEVRFVVKYTGQMANNGKAQAAFQQIQQTMCGWRTSRRLAGAGTRLVLKFVDKDNRTTRQIVSDNATCKVSA